MPIITIFVFEGETSPQDICKCLNGKKFENSWIVAKISRYNRREVFIQYYYYEDVEECLKKAFSEEDLHEIVSFLKENGKDRVLKRTYCFINTLAKTLEVYRGPDHKTQEIVSQLEKLLKIKFTPLKLSSEELQKIYSRYGTELKQAMFKNIDGLLFEILRANNLEENQKFNEYLEKFPSCLRVISFKPRIKFLNSSAYQVTINGDKGTVRFSSGFFNWRPRFEIRQIIFIIASISGALR